MDKLGLGDLVRGFGEHFVLQILFDCGLGRIEDIPKTEKKLQCPERYFRV